MLYLGVAAGGGTTRWLNGNTKISVLSMVAHMDQCSLGTSEDVVWQQRMSIAPHGEQLEPRELTCPPRELVSDAEKGRPGQLIPPTSTLMILLT